MRKTALLPAILLVLATLSGCASTGGQEGGFNLISLDEEWAMRDDLMRQVAREMRVVDDASAVAYLNQVGRRLAGETPLGNRPWDFGIIQDDAVNAFNLPGGLVYVNVGLIRQAETLDQLTGVLAHEIGHGAARHGTQQMTRAYGLNVLAAIALGQDPGASEQVLAQVVGAGVLSNYSRDAENEADQLGVGYAYRAGYDPRGMVLIFRDLLELRSRRPTRVEQFFSSHPLTEDRIQRIEAAVEQLPARRSLAHDTPDYQRFRSRFN